MIPPVETSVNTGQTHQTERSVTVFLMMHGFQQIVTQAERRDNFVVHGLPPLRDGMAVSPLIWRKKLMDSISGNLGYNNNMKSCGPELVAVQLPKTSRLRCHLV